MCRKFPLVGVHLHAHALGRRWCDKPDKNLEKNLDPAIINPIIREKKSSLIRPFHNISNQAIDEIYCIYTHKN